MFPLNNYMYKEFSCLELYRGKISFAIQLKNEFLSITRKWVCNVHESTGGKYYEVFFLPILTVPDFILCGFYYNARENF